VAASMLPELRDVATSSDSPCAANLAEMYFHIELKSSRRHAANKHLDGSSRANISVDILPRCFAATMMSHFVAPHVHATDRETTLFAMVRPAAAAYPAPPLHPQAAHLSQAPTGPPPCLPIVP
jgi:hypothetical protein